MSFLFIHYPRLLRALQASGIPLTPNEPSNNTLKTGVKVSCTDIGCHVPTEGNEGSVTLNARKEDNVTLVGEYSTSCSPEQCRDALQAFMERIEEEHNLIPPTEKILCKVCGDQVFGALTKLQLCPFCRAIQRRG